MRNICVAAVWRSRWAPPIQPSARCGARLTADDTPSPLANRVDGAGIAQEHVIRIAAGKTVRG
ncbi:MAG: hypothetical protein IPJ08_18950 [Burkholderiales bacterium]|nr:hypothetical protein [Burkholderiales bacterium]